VAVVSARDFVLLVHYNKMPNGNIYIMAFDAGRNDLVPETKGVVRANVAVRYNAFLTLLINRSVDGNSSPLMKTRLCALTQQRLTLGAVFQGGSLNRHSRTKETR
jgi:hypothetical protein